MICKKVVYKYCCEDISKIENYNEAIKDNNETWDIHHKNEIILNKSRQELIDLNLYYNRPASELIFLTRVEHNKLHNNGKTYSNETKQKMSIAHKDKYHTDETKQRMSEALKLCWQRRKAKQSFNQIPEDKRSNALF